MLTAMQSLLQEELKILKERIKAHEFAGTDSLSTLGK